MSTASTWGRWTLAIVMLAWLVFIWAWPPAYLTLTVDDSFYYFQIARNIGDGLGSSFDGVNATNGYHPLWLVLLVPITWLDGDDLPVRVALTLQLLLVFVGVRLLARDMGKSMRTLELVAALVLVSFYTVKTMVNGTEAALQFCLLCAATAAFASVESRLTWRSSCWLGLVCGLLVLSRMDALVFGIVLVTMPVLWPQSRGGQGRQSYQLALGGLLGLMVPVSAMMVASWLWFGHPLSVSSVIKGEWIRQAATPGLLVLAVVTSGILIGGFRLLSASLSTEATRKARTFFPLTVYATYVVAAHGILPGRLVFEIWYLPPVVATMLVMAGSAVSYAWGERRRPLVQITLVLVGVGYLGVAVYGWLHRIDPNSYSAYQAARRSGIWIRDNVPADAKVAGWDCGIAAWHSRRGVIQLEGLVNSWDFKREVLDRQELAAYLDRSGVDYLVQPVGDYFFEPQVRSYAGVALGDWLMARAECVGFSGVAAPGRRYAIYLVLSRREGGPPLGQIGPQTVLDLCEGDERVFERRLREADDLVESDSKVEP